MKKKYVVQKGNSATRRQVYVLEAAKPCSPLEGSHGSHDGNSKTKGHAAADAGSIAAREGQSGGRAWGRSTSTDGTRSRGGRRSSRRRSLSGRGRDGHFRNSNLGRDDLGGTISGDSRFDNDGRVGGSESGSASDGQAGGNGLDLGNNARVLVHPRGADALEAGDGLGGLVVSGAVGVQALEDLVGKVAVGAEAASIAIVLALSHANPGVQTLGNDSRAGHLLLWGRRGGILGGLGRKLRGHDGGGRLDVSLSDGADCRADGDSDDGRLARAVRDLRAAVGHGLGLSGEDGGDRLVGCDHGSLNRLNIGRALNGSGLNGSRSRGRRLFGLGCGLNGSGLNGSGLNVSRSRGRRFFGLGCGLNGSGLNVSRSRGRRFFGLSCGLLRGCCGLLFLGRRRGSLFGDCCGQFFLGRRRMRFLGDCCRQFFLRRRRRSLLGLGGRNFDGTCGLHFFRRGRGGDGRSRALGGSVLVTVKVNVGDLNVALVLAVALLGVDEVNLVSTTALAVLDRGTILGAVGRVLASRAVRHIVVELQAAVELGADVEGLDGELVGLGAGSGAEVGGEGLVVATLAGNVVAAKGTASKVVALEGLALAREAAEVEAIIVAEVTGNEVVPLPALLLLGPAPVVGVAGAGEGVGAVPAATAVAGLALVVAPVAVPAAASVTPSSGDLADSGSSCQKSDRVLHCVGVDP
jgi:hypothetical protein